MVLFQIAVSAGLGAFVALERDVTGRDTGMWAHALAGVAGCALALGLLPANVSAIDWAILAGGGAFVAGLLYPRAGAAWMRLEARLGMARRGRLFDPVTFGGAFAIGAACGFGDVAALVFVALVLAGIAAFRPQTADAPTLAPAVAGEAREPRAEPAASVLTQEQLVAEAAAQLAALAAALRQAGAAGSADHRSADSPAPAPATASFARRRGEALPLHNVAIRNRPGVRVSRRCGPDRRILSGAPSRA